MSRLAPIDPAKLTPEQRRVYDSITAGPRGTVRGPFLALMHVPELADPIQQLGAYLRFKTSFPPRLSEFAILLTARHYTCQYEWQAHEPFAQKGGLAQSIIEAVRGRRRPEGMQPDETAVYEYTTELLQNGRIADATYDRAVKAFGTRGTIELGVMIGYYIMIGMTLLAHEMPLPPGVAPPLPA